jgi:hypothetical protein
MIKVFAAAQTRNRRLNGKPCIRVEAVSTEPKAQAYQPDEPSALENAAEKASGSDHFRKGR